MFVFLSTATWAQSVRINEISRASELPVALQHVDLELYNAGNEELDLQGYRFFVNSKFTAIEHELVIPPKGFIQLSFGKKGGDAPTDLDLKLPWKGATLMLWDETGERMLDMFIYPQLLESGSFGRCPDGAVKPAYTNYASIGRPCTEAETTASRASKVSLHRTSDGSICTVVLSGDCDEIRYTLDGSTPTLSSDLYSDELRIPHSQPTLLKARGFSEGKHPGSIFMEAIVATKTNNDVVAISLKNHDLWDAEAGIYTKGAKANFARKGKKWERLAVVQTVDQESGDHSKGEFGIRISGSGTRSLPKRSFKLFKRARYDDSPFAFFDVGNVDELVLRADATPNSFLQNRFIETLVSDHLHHLDVQKSKTIELFLNGGFWGMYRAMPAKDPMWIEDLHHVSGIDMLAGSGYRLVQGSDEGIDEFLELVSRSVLQPKELERLEQIVDVQSMIQMAALDLYTGRADHEFNTRMWREPGGKWRWIAYDFDLWTLPDDASLDRMLAETQIMAPFMKVIWNTPMLRDRLLAEMTALLNGPLAPAAANRVLSVMSKDNEELMWADHTLWTDSLSVLSPNEGKAALQKRILERPQFLFEYLARKSSNELMRIPVVQSRQGHITIDDRKLDKNSAELRTWKGTMLLVEGIPEQGMQFVGWKGMNETSPLILIQAERVEKLEPVFRRKPVAELRP